MKEVKKYESVQPKTGETNKLFGVRYLARHRMRDKRWTAKDKVEQYDGVTRLYEQDAELEEAIREEEHEQNVEKLKRLRKMIDETKKDLKIALEGDKQKVKNMMVHDKKLKILCPTQDLKVGWVS